MAILDWFRRKRPTSLPEAAWNVAVKHDHIRIVRPDGTASEIALGILYAVAIETNDSGPWGADVWWMLFDAPETPSHIFPQGATGEKAVVDRLMKLPGFDFEAMIKAQTSTDNAFFPLWRMPSAT